MATLLTDGINALIQYANEVTGKSDTTLSDAVGSLVEGYGGGSSAIFSKMAVDVLHFDAGVNRSNPVTFAHSLGDIPDFCFLYPKHRVVPIAGTNTRRMQFAVYTSLGAHLQSNTWYKTSYVFTRTYNNTNSQKYYQADVSTNYFSNITANSVTLGVGSINEGSFVGDWILVTAKIADEYQQSEIIYS